jgi:hypothetical protein
VGRSRLPMGLVVFVVGAGSLGTEIAAARLLAPYFGASTVVWANSFGYWLGGRVAERHPHRRGLHALVLAAGVVLAAVPFAASRLLDLADRAAVSLSSGEFAGSLIGLVVLVAPPVLLLGAVAPYAVQLSVRSVDTSGEVAGRLYAISTAGSLAGTFLSALVLIPLVGTARTFVGFALAVAVVGALGLRPRWLAVPAAMAALLAL